MRIRVLPLAIAVAVAGAALSGAAAVPGPGDESGPPGPGLVTLWRGDPVTHALNLRDGSFGGRIAGNELFETRAHLDYGNWEDAALTVALDEDDRGILLDLGHWKDLATAYGYEELVGGGVGFATIHFEGRDLRIAKRVPRGAYQDLREGRDLTTLRSGVRFASLPAVEGHVYLARVEDAKDRFEPVYAKILVVSHDPGDRVTIRWLPL